MPIQCNFSRTSWCLAVEDLTALGGIVGKDDYRQVLEDAPPGIFDARSWAYWNLVCGRQPAPPLPMRRF